MGNGLWSGPGQQGGGGMLGNFAGMGSGLKQFLGFGGKAGFVGPQLPTSFMGNLSKLGHSNAALMGGAALALMGVRRGGLSGLGMTTAGEALIGFKYGGGLGAAIGGAIGLGVGLVGLFRKSAEDKAKQKIRDTYGVEIKDKGVLKQIVEMAKQSYGGNLDMAVKSQQVADLVRLYALTYGQSTGKLPQMMTQGSLVQGGGMLRQGQSYYNGTLQSPGGGAIPSSAVGVPFVPQNMLAFLHRGERVLPATENAAYLNMEKFFGRLFGASNNSDNRSGAPSVVNIHIPGAKDFFEKETTSVVLRNPRTVQKASTRATRSNYNRRELAALQFNPGTLTS